MKFLNIIIFLSVILGFSVNAVRADQTAMDIWSRDYSATLKKSKASGKPALVYFSGSYWCGFCKRLNDEIIYGEAFRSFAPKNFELVNLDFPQPAPTGDRAYELNVWLKEQHGVRGFPTLLILDGDGVVLGRVGYSGNGFKEFVRELMEVARISSDTVAGEFKSLPAIEVKACEVRETTHTFLHST